MDKTPMNISDEQIKEFIRLCREEYYLFDFKRIEKWLRERDLSEKEILTDRKKYVRKLYKQEFFAYRNGNSARFFRVIPNSHNADYTTVDVKGVYFERNDKMTADEKFGTSSEQVEWIRDNMDLKPISRKMYYEIIDTYYSLHHKFESFVLDIKNIETFN